MHRLSVTDKGGGRGREREGEREKKRCFGMGITGRETWLGINRKRTSRTGIETKLADV